MEQGKKYNGYIVVGHGLDSEYEIYPFIFPDKELANDFILRRNRVFDDGEHNQHLISIYTGYMNFVSDFDVLDVQDTALIDDVTDMKPVSSIDDIVFLDSRLVQVLMENNKYRTAICRCLTVDHQPINEPIISLDDTEFGRRCFSCLRMSFSIPIVNFKNLEPNKYFDRSLKLYCIEVLRELNADFGKYHEGTTLTLTTEDMQRIHNKIFPEVCKICKSKMFTELFKEVK